MVHDKERSRFFSTSSGESAATIAANAAAEECQVSCFEVSTIGDAEEFFTNYGGMTSSASDTDDFAIDWRPPPNVFAKMTTRVISYSQTRPTILPCVGSLQKILLEGRGTASSPRPGRAPDQFLANRLRQLLCGIYRRIWRFWFHSYSAKVSLSLPTQPPYHN